MKHVLVVDDSSTLRRMVIASLRSVGNIQCHEAGNGLEAIERLSLSPIHLMIIDLNMPDMHGLEVVQFVRGNPSFKGIPIIVLTTRGDEDTRAAALSGGASVYMTKPFQPKGLATAVRELLVLE
jgi:two-component system chemotaxis response regulator CheY